MRIAVACRLREIGMLQFLNNPWTQTIVGGIIASLFIILIQKLLKSRSHHHSTEAVSSDVHAERSESRSLLVHDQTNRQALDAQSIHLLSMRWLYSWGIAYLLLIVLFLATWTISHNPKYGLDSPLFVFVVLAVVGIGSVIVISIIQVSEINNLVADWGELVGVSICGQFVVWIFIMSNVPSALAIITCWALFSVISGLNSIFFGISFYRQMCLSK